MAEPLLHGDAWHGRHENWIAVENLVAKLEAPFLPPNPGNEIYYGWEPLPFLDFLDGMTVVRDTLGPGAWKFLDVGAGIGDKVALAQELKFDSCGLDHHQPYIEVAQKLFDTEIILADAEHFAGYGEFDAVYCYRIAKDQEAQQRINRQIISQLHSGALYFCIGPPEPEGLQQHISGNVWKK